MHACPYVRRHQKKRSPADLPVTAVRDLDATRIHNPDPACNAQPLTTTSDSFRGQLASSSSRIRPDQTELLTYRAILTAGSGGRQFRTHGKQQTPRLLPEGIIAVVEARMFPCAILILRLLYGTSLRTLSMMKGAVYITTRRCPLLSRIQLAVVILN